MNPEAHYEFSKLLCRLNLEGEGHIVVSREGHGLCLHAYVPMSDSAVAMSLTPGEAVLLADWLRHSLS